MFLGSSLGSYSGKYRWSKNCSATSSFLFNCCWSWCFSFSWCISCNCVSSDILSWNRSFKNFASCPCYLAWTFFCFLFFSFFWMENLSRFCWPSMPSPRTLSSLSDPPSPPSPPRALGSRLLGRGASGGGIRLPYLSHLGTNGAWYSGAFPPAPATYERFRFKAVSN